MSAKSKLSFYLSGVILSLIFFTGCVSLQYTQGTPTPPRVSGIFHTVSAGQTLWQISRMYNIGLGELVRANNISDAASIETGQQIFIPEAYKILASNTKVSFEDFIWPLKGKVISRFKEVQSNMVNKGINIQSELVQDVVASRSGRVVFAHHNFKGFGKTVIIEHADNFMTVYAGFQDIFVKVGERVNRGSVIAKMGAPEKEKNSHLHFEIRKGHLPQNPIFFLPS